MAESTVERLVVEFEARTNQLERSMERLQRRNAQAMNGIAQGSRRSLGQFERSISRTARTVDREAGRMSRAARSIENSFMGLSRAAAAGIIGGAAIHNIKQYADTWTQAGNAIKAASAITGLQTRSLKDLNDIASDTRSGFEETVDLYARLVRSAYQVADSEQEIARATELVNKAFKAGGSAASEQAAGILQLGQALGSGFLQGDELRSLRENAPLIAKAIADEFGVTIGQLKQLGADGLLTSERVFKAILKGADDIERAFAATTPTIADTFTKLKNSTLEFVGALDKASGASIEVRKNLDGVVTEIDRITDAVTRYHQNGGLDSFLDIFGLRLEEGGVADRIRDKIVKIQTTMREAAQDIARQQKLIQEQIKATEDVIEDMNQAAEDNRGSAIAAEFEAAAREAEQDLRLLQDELVRLQRAAEAAAANGGNALENLAKSAVAAMNAAQAAGKAASEAAAQSYGAGLTYRSNRHGTSVGVYSYTAPATDNGPSGGGSSSGGGVQYDSSGLPYTVQGGVRVPAYAEGGYTGDGGKYEPAGVAHKGEYIFTKEETAAIGVSTLRALAKNANRGYSAGGYVGTSTATVLPGGDALARIETNTSELCDKMERAIQYLSTISTDIVTLGNRITRAMTVSASSSYSSGSSGSSSGGGNAITRHVVGSSLGGGSGPTYGSFNYDRVVTIGGPGGNAHLYYADGQLVHFDGITGVEASTLRMSMATGGVIGGKFSGGGSMRGDKQMTQFFKNPEEAVYVLTGAQQEAFRKMGEGVNNGAKGDNRPPQITLGPNYFPVTEPANPASRQALMDDLARTITAAMASKNG